jgi:hypothetical protein
MGDDWIDLERIRRKAPKEESSLRGFKSLIVLIILAAAAFFILYKMAKNMAPQGPAAGSIPPSAISAQLSEGSREAS